MMEKEEMKLKKSTPAGKGTLHFSDVLATLSIILKKQVMRQGQLQKTEEVQRMQSNLSERLSKCTRFASLSLTEKKESLN